MTLCSDLLKNKRIMLRTFWIGLFAMVLLLCACKENPLFQQNYHPPPFRFKKKAISKVEKPKIKIYYTSVNKRDPFRSPFLASERIRASEYSAKKDKVDDNVKRAKTILEFYPLEQLKVTAVITGISNPIALVTEPGGSGHTVRRGTPLGSHGGRVSRIYSNGIEVSEISKDPKTKLQRIAKKFIRIKGASATRNQRFGQLSIAGRKVYIDAQGLMRFVPGRGNDNTVLEQTETTKQSLRSK